MINFEIFIENFHHLELYIYYIYYYITDAYGIIYNCHFLQ